MNKHTIEMIQNYGKFYTVADVAELAIKVSSCFKDFMDSSKTRKFVDVCINGARTGNYNEQQDVLTELFEDTYKKLCENVDAFEEKFHELDLDTVAEFESIAEWIISMNTSDGKPQLKGSLSSGALRRFFMFKQHIIADYGSYGWILYETLYISSFLEVSNYSKPAKNSLRELFEGTRKYSKGSSYKKKLFERVV